MTLKHRLLPAERLKKLKTLLNTKKHLRIIEAHNGLSGVIGSTASYEDSAGNHNEFDGLWVSSLTDSAAKAHPDTEVIDVSSRLQTIQQILQVTNKPVIVDGDTGGEATQFEYFCSKLENMGVSAVVIEDKTYPKRNSLDADVAHILEDPNQFATKVNRAKAVCLSSDFMIFTRIESFIAGRDLEDALYRANIYLESQADGILIHSSQKDPSQVYAFMEAYQKLCEQKNIHKPVICVPTTYNQITDEALFSHGINIAIYANHLLRAAHKAMTETCQSILTHKRSHEIQSEISSVKEIMHDVGFYDVKDKDKTYDGNPMPIIIPASSKPAGFVGTTMENAAISNIMIDEKPLLQWQVLNLKEIGFKNLVLISGYGRGQLPKFNIEEIYNDDFNNTGLLHTLMLAKKHMKNGFIMVFGDIFFNKEIIANYLLNTKGDVVLLTDHSFNLHTKKQIKPSTDLVKIDQRNQTSLRKPSLVTEKIIDIGADLDINSATHEFVGIAKFSANGAKKLCETFEKIKSTKDASAFNQLDFNAIIKALIADGISVEGLEINHGWSEVHTMTDVAAIEKTINRAKQQQQSPTTI